MKVVDSSIVVEALSGRPSAKFVLVDDDLFAPHLLDLETVSTFRRYVAAGRVSDANATTALERLRQLGIMRYPVHGLTARIWELRHNLTSYDAAYVAVAEALECPLVTTDARMASAPGARCEFQLIAI